MANNTRQRQGRDFIELENPLKNAEMALESNCNQIDGILNNGADDDQKKESIFKRLEEIKSKYPRSAEPVDGHEPPERGLF